MNDLEKWVMSEMIDKLEEYEGVTAYPSDLAYMLFEEANCTGSYTCSTFEAKEWCHQFFNQLGDAVEDYSFNLGEPPSNAFLFPERFQVEIIIFLASNLVWLSEYVTERIDNDDEFILTKEVIDVIAKEWHEAIAEDIPEE